MRKRTKKITVSNEKRKTVACLLLPPFDGRCSGRQALEAPKKLLGCEAPGRLSKRQARETLSGLACPGDRQQGLLGEWPLIQRPPEWPEPYIVVEVGDHSGWIGSNTPRWSRFYFVPLGSVGELLRAHGVSIDAWLKEEWLTRHPKEVQDEVAAAVRKANGLRRRRAAAA